MSCQTNPAKVAVVGAAAGISGSGSIFGYNIGQIAAKTPDFDKVGEATGSVSDALLRVIDPTDPEARQSARALTATASTLVNIGAWVTGIKPTLAVANRVIGVTGCVTGMAGNWAAALCKSGNTGTVEVKKRFLFFFTSKQKVQLTQSNLLTSYFNRADVLPGAEVEHTKGTLFRVGGNSWHWGETTVYTSRGRQTITHLQTLALPSSHYYFNRPVAAQDMVELAGGTTKPETIQGFAGSVSKTETLCTGWAAAKQNLILARLHWPPLKVGIGT
ncbi:MAG: hypothetical protein U0401_32320 [Anaerolineae bacterium]